LAVFTTAVADLGEFMNQMHEIRVIFSTAPPDKSGIIAQMLVDTRMVACVNIVPVQSCYRWNGEFCNETEHLLIIKTTEEKVQEVIAAIKAHHPYEIPEIIALPVTEGHLPYLEWVYQETRDIV
jgi:periplasmic divalent cation tolerance protein